MPARKTAYVWGGIIIAASITLILCAAIIPFEFESPSIFYKFGFKKVLLRAGKVTGLIAAVLLLYQLPSAGRLKNLDRVFSLPFLYRYHVVGAFVILALVLLHPACMLLSEGIYSLPLEGRYWPEWVGAGLLLLVLCQVVVAGSRRFFSIPYHVWRTVHKWVGVIIVLALTVHVLYVSKTFEQAGPPRIAVFAALIGWALLWIGIRISSRRRHPFTVNRVTPAGKDAYAVDLLPVAGEIFPYTSGQFAFLSVHANGISKEPHPFTLASSYTRPGSLQVIVRCRGDWTDRIDSLKEGDRVFIQGPFGRYTYELAPSAKKIIMIAGGIGITPMLSMLRHMKDRKESRNVTLIWSNRSEDYLFARTELEEMRERLKQFKWIPVFTRQKGSFGYFGRLDKTTMEGFLKDGPLNAVVFVCGPLPMVQRVRSILKELGFRNSAIKVELFSL